MKTPLLIDVPKTHPSRIDKLKAFKSEHQIETHYTSGLTKQECPWIAAHMPSCRQHGYGVTEASDLFDCVSKVGRLMDESGTCAYGATEREAIRELCENLDIPCPL